MSSFITVYENWFLLLIKGWNQRRIATPKRRTPVPCKIDRNSIFRETRTGHFFGRASQIFGTSKVFGRTSTVSGTSTPTTRRTTSFRRTIARRETRETSETWSRSRYSHLATFHRFYSYLTWPLLLINFNYTFEQLQDLFSNCYC